MLNIALIEPEIPQNTGNIARTCACTNTRLHLVRPFGFEISDKTVKRAGLDYWDKVEIFYYDSLSEFLQKNKDKEMFFLSTKAKNRYSDCSFPDECFLVFGKETKGLPETLLNENADRALRIPMGESLRSLNLSNSVAIVLYEALRQTGFNGLR